MTDISQTVFHLNREQEERHTEELAERLKLPYINLVGYPLGKEILSIVPEEAALKMQAIPYLKIGRSVKIGLAKPADEAIAAALRKFGQQIGVEFAPAVISKTSFFYGVSMYEKLKEAARQETAQTREQSEAVWKTEIKDLASISQVAKKVTVTELLDVVMTGALKTHTSDVHMEPTESDFLIRYRIDGILQDVVRLTLAQHKQLVSRVKFLCQLRMDLSNQPQDGRFSIKGSTGENIDLRVSIMPTSFGESIVIRILGQELSVLKIDNLGFRPEALAAIREAISKPHGMVLTSGPTGSGKTSTLYAILSELKKPGIKIITLEDPVEYRLPGIEQSQVKPGAGYEFADGLRASLRQDPDVLMVGEIRDAETAEIAIQAALTGHLVISTIHSNSAPAVFVRFIEMGIKPFLLSGSINIVMAQRLIRKLCPECKEAYQPRPEVWQEVINNLVPIKDRLSPEVQAKLAEAAPTLYRGKGCAKCGNNGFFGREVVIEVLVPNEVIESLVGKSASIAEFNKAAREQGMVTMEQDGLMKALMGTTTVEEVWRVTKD